MNAEQKQRAQIAIKKWWAADSSKSVLSTGYEISELLQELVDAPEAEPVARVTGYYAGYLSIATVDGRVLPTGTALYTAPPAPIVLDGWIRAVDEALVVHHIGIADRADGYEEAKKKLNGLLAITSDIARDCSEAPADVARDAERYRWLTQDHPASETRKLVDEIGYCLSVRGYGATSAAIDAAIERDKQKGGEA